MKRLWSWWVELLSREESGECLAAMRILAAIAVLTLVAVPLVHGFVELLYYPVEAGGYLQLGAGSWFVDLCGGPSPGLAWGLLAGAGAAGLALLFGVQARVAALVAGQCLLALRGLNSMQGSYAAILSNALWLLVLARSDATWSLRARLRTGAWRSEELVPAWPRYLGVFQLVVLYLWTGLSKISVAWIGDYSALYYILQTPTWQRFDMSGLASAYPLTQVLTGMVWVWEFSFPIILLAAYFRETAARPGRVRALFNRFDIRVPYLLFGLGAHAMIGTLMVVGPFFIATLSFYPCMLDPDTWRAYLARLGIGTREGGSHTQA